MYRITFYHRNGHFKHYDVDAKDAKDAFRIAYEKPEAKNRVYTDVGVMRIPTGISCIGLQVCTCDVKREDYHTDHVIIRAESEEKARDWYLKNLAGKRFEFYVDRLDDNGRYRFENIQGSYFATGDAFDYDSTIEKGA